MKIKIIPKQTQQTILAPTMQQSIEVLLLPLTELQNAVEQELQENPILEVDEEIPLKDHNILDEFINLNLRRHVESSGHNVDYGYNPDDDRPDSAPIANVTPLEDYLLQQLRLETTDPMELKIGELIIGNLNEDGFFTSSCHYIAQMLNLEDPMPVEMILHIIQNFEPLGIASRNLKECLLTQIHYNFNGSGALIARTVNEHLDDIGHKKYAKIAKSLKIPVEKVKEIAQSISTLEPKPARKYRPITNNIYIKPDATIYKDSSGEYKVRVSQDNIPTLKISSAYQAMLKQPKRTVEEVEFIRSKIKGGLWFIRSIEQRNQTIRQIVEYIADKQKDFFEFGHLALKPMIFRDVAQEIGRNESTICRAVNNKYIDTPQGLLAMKYFFSQGISSENAYGSVSSRSVKEEIKQIVEKENKRQPLSDQEIQNRLSESGVNIARRTISKYRKVLNILPSHLRKE